MDLRKIKIADLVPASYNLRKVMKLSDREFGKIKRSIQEFGYREPFIVNSYRRSPACDGPAGPRLTIEE